MHLNLTSNRNQSSRWIWVAFCLSLGLSVYVFFNEEEVRKNLTENVNNDVLVSPSVNHRKPMPLNTVKQITSTKLAPLLMTNNKAERALPLNTQRNLFKVLDWQSDAKKISLKNLPPLAPATPIAPPIPFVYMGKLENTPKGTVVYLQGNNKVYTVAKGEKIDPFWRLDDEFIISLQLTYLPLNVQQVLLKTQKLDISAPISNLN